MSEAGFTPGPWLEGERNQAGMSIYAHFPDEKFGQITGSVCCVWSHLYLPPQVANANAALILAAPDLYDAADNALNALIGCCVPAGGVDDRKTILEAQAMLRAALAKALGR